MARGGRIVSTATINAMAKSTCAATVTVIGSLGCPGGRGSSAASRRQSSAPLSRPVSPAPGTLDPQQANRSDASCGSNSRKRKRARVTNGADCDDALPAGEKNSHSSNHGSTGELPH